MFKPGDRVEFIIPHAPHNQRPPVSCTIKHVGNTTYHAVDDDDNWFSSHHENFRLAPNHVKRFEPYDPNDPFAAATRSSQRIIIGIAGRKGHGKDTAAQGLPGFENVKFAGGIKAMVRAFLVYVGMSADTIDRCVDGDMKETPLACFGGETTRYVMQTLGTEWGRDMIWDEIWINSAKMRADQFDKVAITDLRFPNEGDAIEAWGGTTVKIVDPRKPVKVGEHPSEDLIDDLPVHYVIYNTRDIPFLHEQVQALHRTLSSGWQNRLPKRVSRRDVEQF